MTTQPGKQRLIRMVILLAGIFLGQAALYGPSLMGKRILLPLDILTGAGIYIPRTAETSRVQIENIYLSDLIYAFEPARRFAVEELKAGRFPSWADYQFAGAPIVGPRFSPFILFQCLGASPIWIAWAQVLLAFVAGTGAYVFARRVLKVGFWPAAIGGWCYPLTGIFVFWQGYPTCLSVCWLPWLLWSVHDVIEGEGTYAAMRVSLLTMLVLLSGNLDVAAQVLLVSSFFALWWLIVKNRQAVLSAVPVKLALTLGLAWVLGFGMAAYYLMPALEYTNTGARMVRRGGGEEERPPVGISALPQTVLPDMYGKFGFMKRGSFRYTGDSQQESTAAAYAGLPAALLLAPLAFASRRYRAISCFLAVGIFLGLAWSLNFVGFVELMRLPGLNMLSHNRFVLFTGFGILMLAVIGLETIREKTVSWNKWMWLPAAVAVALYAFCSYRALFLPEPIATELEALIQQGKHAGWIRTIESVREVQASFVQTYTFGAVLCAISAGVLVLLRFKASWVQRSFLALGILMLADLLWFGQGRSVQADPNLYYPRISVLEQLAADKAARVIGYQCLPANLASMSGLHDVRGYDAVDPAAYVELLTLGEEPSPVTHAYARTQILAPKYQLTAEGDAKLSPIMDVLGVRDVIFRGTPPPQAKPILEGQDYWVCRNPNALSRAFVPHHVEVVKNSADRLARLASPEFNPREVAFLETETDLRITAVSGRAEIVSQSPVNVKVAAKLDAPGLLVLADTWDAGWKAWRETNSLPILKVDHALRGVFLPAGNSEVEFRYEPDSFRRGVKIAALSAVLLMAWGLLLGRKKGNTSGPAGL